ncbi:hypothetical protein CJ030_MR7G018893 [Morella rubra]|uniref:Uncharacterized protein n=1 Tax=Morella rubra TaxID=262757 RepID=A0A6A1V283_9ROSI|nr:hypothetical protein CJ030_MR7G018893 [Morella rubra]
MARNSLSLANPIYPLPYLKTPSPTAFNLLTPTTAVMSSSRSKRPSHQTPSSISSRARKKGRGNKESTPTPEAYIYRSGLYKNRFVQDFRNRKVIARRWADFQWFSVVLANFQFSKSEDAISYVNGKQLDLSDSSLNSLASAPNGGKKFLDAYSWIGMSEIEPIDILSVVLDNPTLNMKVDLTGEVRRKLKDSKEYNKKTLRLMDFMQNEDGEWVKKGVVTPQTGCEWGSAYKEESEDEEEGDTERNPTGTRTSMGE